MSQPSAFARRIVSSAVLAATLGLSGCFGLAVTGAAIGTVAVLDRRSIGAQTEDETIELRGARVLNESVNKDPMASVAITSFNRRALLTGQVPTEEMRAQAEEIVRTRVPNIKDIYNEVELFFLRPRDIAVYVGQGTVHAGMTGRDLLLDSGVDAYGAVNLFIGLGNVEDFGKTLFAYADGKRLLDALFFHIGKHFRQAVA